MSSDSLICRIMRVRSNVAQYWCVIVFQKWFFTSNFIHLLISELVSRDQVSYLNSSHFYPRQKNIFLHSPADTFGDVEICLKFSIIEPCVWFLQFPRVYLIKIDSKSSSRGGLLGSCWRRKAKNVQKSERVIKSARTQKHFTLIVINNREPELPPVSESSDDVFLVSQKWDTFRLFYCVIVAMINLCKRKFISSSPQYFNH